MCHRERKMGTMVEKIQHVNQSISPTRKGPVHLPDQKGALRIKGDPKKMPGALPPPPPWLTQILPSQPHEKNFLEGENENQEGLSYSTTHPPMSLEPTTQAPQLQWDPPRFCSQLIILRYHISCDWTALLKSMPHPPSLVKDRGMSQQTCTFRTRWRMHGVTSESGNMHWPNNEHI